MNMSPTTTNWYEMTLIDELEYRYTNPSDVDQSTKFENDLIKSANKIHKLYDLLYSDCKIQIDELENS